MGGTPRSKKVVEHDFKRGVFAVRHIISLSAPAFFSSQEHAFHDVIHVAGGHDLPPGIWQREHSALAPLPVRESRPPPLRGLRICRQRLDFRLLVRMRESSSALALKHRQQIPVGRQQEHRSGGERERHQP
jgi:hypothetical protein